MKNLSISFCFFKVLQVLALILLPILLLVCVMFPAFSGIINKILTGEEAVTEPDTKTDTNKEEEYQFSVKFHTHELYTPEQIPKKILENNDLRSVDVIAIDDKGHLFIAFFYYRTNLWCNEDGYLPFVSKKWKWFYSPIEKNDAFPNQKIR